ncbi:hypothetical protein RRG08_053227 [Elysia crispata]|uniref:Uncharacterized protein n=1 Tax=Elysia crispata TaxID=231223 RepID=A0AAE1E2X4_9GAST|nr:hypothetical protein RRG08_053227 [Elysia crispata]
MDSVRRQDFLVLNTYGQLVDTLRTDLGDDETRIDSVETAGALETPLCGDVSGSVQMSTSRLVSLWSAGVLSRELGCRYRPELMSIEGIGCVVPAGRLCYLSDQFRGQRLCNNKVNTTLPQAGRMLDEITPREVSPIPPRSRI